MPDRVARQFGREQRIPRPMINLGFGTCLSSDIRKYAKIYSSTDDNWANIEQHTLNVHDLGEVARTPMATTADYLEWYVRISHVAVHNEEHGPRLDGVDSLMAQFDYQVLPVFLFQEIYIIVILYFHIIIYAVSFYSGFNICMGCYKDCRKRFPGSRTSQSISDRRSMICKHMLVQGDTQA